MSTTNTENIAKQLPVAMYALAQHMLDQQLPAPLRIEGPHSCDHAPGLIVAVAADHLEAWTESIHVDDIVITASTKILEYPDLPDREIVTVYGRIPIGVQVVLKASRLRVSHLMSVPA